VSWNLNGSSSEFTFDGRVVELLGGQIYTLSFAGAGYFVGNDHALLHEAAFLELMRKASLPEGKWAIAIPKVGH